MTSPSRLPNALIPGTDERTTTASRAKCHRPTFTKFLVSLVISYWTMDISMMGRPEARE
jgi:hypothetical protein